jgi:hypothetical protein
MKSLRTRVFLAVLVLAASAGAFGQSASSSSSASESHQAGSPNIPSAGGRNRPASVPDGYVITPFGYFHPSCVQSLAKGERLLADGRVQHPDGTLEENVAVCSYQRYTPTGQPVSAGEAKMSTGKIGGTVTKTSPEVRGWIENANITTGSATKSYGALIAIWTVPPQPIANDGQVLYFFPGFEDINDLQTSILQPVLGWYQGQWSIASWNCCLNNIVTNSPAVNVSPGDAIYGSITSTCPAGTLSCTTWNVLSLDLFTGESTTLRDTPSQGQVFNWAFGGVLEPYYVITCDDYPSNRQISFYNEVLDEHLHPIIDPKWTTAANSSQTPQCNYDVKVMPNEVMLDY